MKILFDLFPVIVFFLAFKVWGIYSATAIAIVATALQIAWVWFRHGKVDTMLWVSLALVTVFGGATLALQDETFIKWKPTVLYWLFAVALLGAAVFFKTNLMRKLMGQQIALPDAIWSQVNASWIGFFTFMGFANLYVAYSYSTDTWVNFKLFGGMGLMLVFMLAQGFLLSKHMLELPEKE